MFEPPNIINKRAENKKLSKIVHFLIIKINISRITINNTIIMVEITLIAGGL